MRRGKYTHVDGVSDASSTISSGEAMDETGTWINQIDASSWRKMRKGESNFNKLWRNQKITEEGKQAQGDGCERVVTGRKQTETEDYVWF